MEHSEKGEKGEGCGFFFFFCFLFSLFPSYLANYLKIVRHSSPTTRLQREGGRGGATPAAAAPKKGQQRAA